jgi:O-antigen ligase
LPVAILLLAVPTVAVLQFRAIALVVSLGLLATVIAHWRAHRALPWPPPGAAATALAAAVALGLFTAASALWAPDPGRTLGTGLRFAGFVLLGAGAARAVAGAPPAHLRRLRAWLVIGLALGIALAAFDHLSGNALRAAVRGLSEAPATLGFGLKPAVSVIAVLLPLAAALPGTPAALRVALVLAGLATAVILPAESAKLAAFAGIAVLLLAGLLRGAARALGVAAAVAVLAAPLLTAAILPRLPSLEALPPSAAHRILIWDFAEDRIAERPLLGWGGEASRAVPGGRDVFDAATLQRYGLTSADSRAWFARPAAQRLPLHTHNAPLQVWLELGAVGAALAAWLMAALGFAAARASPAPGAAGCLAASLTVGMLSYGIWQEWWIALLLLLVVAIAALSALDRYEAPSSSAR